MKSQFVVTEAAQRPASTDKACFYCATDIGGYHDADCVLVSRKVKVRMIVEYDVKVPASWTKENIEFHRNDGSWCASSAIRELEHIKEDGCLCGCARFEYIEDRSAAFLEED